MMVKLRPRWMTQLQKLEKGIKYYTLKLKVTNCIQYYLFNLFIVLRASQERLKY